MPAVSLWPSPTPLPSRATSRKSSTSARYAASMPTSRRLPRRYSTCAGRSPASTPKDSRTPRSRPSRAVRSPMPYAVTSIFRCTRAWTSAHLLTESVAAGHHAVGFALDPANEPKYVGVGEQRFHGVVLPLQLLLRQSTMNLPVASTAQRHGAMQFLSTKQPLHPLVPVTAARDQMVPGAPLHNPPTQPTSPTEIRHPGHNTIDCTPAQPQDERMTDEGRIGYHKPK